MVTLLKELSGFDDDMLKSSMEHVLKECNAIDKQQIEWNRSQWMAAAKAFLTNLQTSEWSNLNAALNSVVITFIHILTYPNNAVGCVVISYKLSLNVSQVIADPMSPEQIDRIDEEYNEVENEFEQLLAEESTLHKEIYRNDSRNVDGIEKRNQLEEEIRSELVPCMLLSFSFLIGQCVVIC